MTSGTKTINQNYGNFSSRTWNGTDGRYYIVAGRKKTKWNNYTMTEYVHTGSPSVYPTGGPYYINVGSAGNAIETDIPGYKNVALQSKITSKVRGHDFNALVVGGEADKTVHLVTNTIRTIGGALRDVKQRRFSDAARRLGIDGHTSKLHPKDVSGRWLEMQYGWLPLVNDCYEAANMLHERTSGPRKSVIHSSTSWTKPYNGSASPINWTGDGTFKITKHIWYEMTEQLSNARSLGLENPLTLAWELMPYSFVIDWFIPIGSYLDNMSVIPTLSGRSMTMIVREWTCSGAGTSKYYKGASASYRKVAVVRTVGSGLSLGTPSFKSFSEAMGGKHIANAIALAHQRMR